MTVDYIIVGQGLAGTAFAFKAIGEGRSVYIIDAPDYSKSSKVAAGLYNPIVFKRLTQSWKIDELLPYAENFYGDLEKYLNTTLLHKRDILKVFADEEEQLFWKKKSTEAALVNYLSENVSEQLTTTLVNNPHGVAAVKNAGYLAVKKTVELFRKKMQEQNLLLEELFDYSGLQIESGNVKYKNINAKHIIFCEGHCATENPYFPELAFKLTKGEILTIKIEGGSGFADEIKNRCLNKGVFILPLGDDTYKVGATYEWAELNETTTEKGLAELKTKLDKVLNVDYSIVAHEAAIRPTVNDRRPMLGLHPQHAELAVFNGMGTKGVLLAPFFANELFNHIEQQAPIDKDVDIKRFYK